VDGKFRNGKPVWVLSEHGHGGQAVGDEWGGDVSRLTDVVPSLLAHQDLCEHTFSSKHEAFAVGITLGRARHQPI
jgi:hypothetical protein